MIELFSHQNKPFRWKIFIKTTIEDFKNFIKEESFSEEKIQFILGKICDESESEFEFISINDELYHDYLKFKESCIILYSSSIYL